MTTTASSLDPSRLLEVAGTLRLAGHPDRARVLLLLREHGTLGSADLAQELGLEAGSNSVGLTLLRYGGLIRSDRQGRSNHHELTEIGERVAGMLADLAGA